MPDTIPGSPSTAARHTARTGGIQRGWFQQLQALEDAIAYRRARVSAPCPDCSVGGRTCDDHACDLNLIAAYQQTAIAALLDVSSQIDASRSGSSPPAAVRGNDPAGLREEFRQAAAGLP